MGSSIVNGIVVNDGIHKVVEDMIVDSLRWICEDSDTADAVFRVLPRDVTDKVLAWVAGALLSDAAVDAMLECSYGWVDYEAGTTYKDLPESEKQEVRPEGRHEITAALRAVGIMEADDAG